MKFNTFIYYGAKIDKNDYENLTNKLGIMELYSKIFSVGLQFREIGEIGKSWDYVVGKEIKWVQDSVLDMEFINNEFIMNDIHLKIDNEDETRQKLLKLGITNIPKYYIFTCWDNN